MPGAAGHTDRAEKADSGSVHTGEPVPSPSSPTLTGLHTSTAITRTVFRTVHRATSTDTPNSGYPYRIDWSVGSFSFRLRPLLFSVRPDTILISFQFVHGFIMHLVFFMVSVCFCHYPDPVPSCAGGGVSSLVFSVSILFTILENCHGHRHRHLAGDLLANPDLHVLSSSHLRSKRGKQSKRRGHHERASGAWIGHHRLVIFLLGSLLISSHPLISSRIISDDYLG